jgi:hypothetical protein
MFTTSTVRAINWAWKKKLLMNRELLLENMSEELLEGAKMLVSSKIEGKQLSDVPADELQKYLRWFRR